MDVSLQTKLTTFTSVTAGFVCACLSPVHFLTGFALGILCGNIVGNGMVDTAKESPNMESSGPRQKAIYQLSHALPGLATTGLTSCACFVLVSEVSLPIILGPLLLGTSGFSLGVTLGLYFRLDQLGRWAQQTSSKFVLNDLNQVVL